MQRKLANMSSARSRWRQHYQRLMQSSRLVRKPEYCSRLVSCSAPRLPSRRSRGWSKQAHSATWSAFAPLPSVGCPTTIGSTRLIKAAVSSSILSSISWTYGTGLEAMFSPSMRKGEHTSWKARDVSSLPIMRWSRFSSQVARWGVFLAVGQQDTEISSLKSTGQRDQHSWIFSSVKPRLYMLTMHLGFHL